MNNDFKKILPHIFLVAAGILIIVGFYALVASEEAKTRDTVRMQEVIGIKQGLYRYYLNHAAYPPAPQPVILGEMDTACLNDKGFVSRTSQECMARAYLLPVPPGHTYVSLGEEGNEPCTSSIGCPRYAISFQLETNLFVKKGMHILTPEGLQ